MELNSTSEINLAAVILDLILKYLLKKYLLSIHWEPYSDLGSEYNDE